MSSVAREQMERRLREYKSTVMRAARELRNETRNLVNNEEPAAMDAWKSLDTALSACDDFLANECSTRDAVVVHGSSFVPHKDPHTGETLYTQTAASMRIEAVQRADRGELLPCPFCGDNNERDPDRIVVDKNLRDGCLASQIEAFAYSVRCGSCAAVGPWTKSESSARVQWNFRTREVSVTTRDVAMTDAVTAERERWRKAVKSYLSALVGKPESPNALHRLFAMLEDA